MRQVALLALMLAVGGCRGGKAKGRDGGSARDAAAVVDAARAEDGLELGFVKGRVYVAEEKHGAQTRVLEGGAWRVIDGGGAGVFPSGSMWQGGLLVIAAEGEHEADHVEQLAVVRGDRIERFGPQAQLVRNPVVAGETLVVETNRDGFRDLYRVDAAGTPRRLTENREGNFEPALSPDGATLAFTSSRDGDAEVYRLSLAGGAATRLTAFHKDDWGPQWSPDGKTLVFLSDREGRPRLFAMKPDGTEQRRLTAETTPEAVEDLPRFSPDGTALAYTRAIGSVQVIHVLEVATGKARALTPPDYSDRDFAWSPDGAHLAVSRHAVLGGKLDPPALTFVRVSDGALEAMDPRIAPFLVRWLP